MSKTELPLVTELGEGTIIVETDWHCCGTLRTRALEIDPVRGVTKNDRAFGIYPLICSGSDLDEARKQHGWVVHAVRVKAEEAGLASLTAAGL